MSQPQESSPLASATPLCPSTECSASDQTLVQNAELFEVINVLQATLDARLQLAKSLSEGHHLLAAARYKVGTQRVSATQLPGPDSDHTAAIRVATDTDGDRSVEEVKDAPDALRRFGVLLPTEMRQAQKAFQRAAHLAVEVANLQNKLNQLQN